MTVLQTIGVYVLIPLALYAVISLFTLWPKIARGPRYRPGQEWNHEPMWWMGNLDAAGTVALRRDERGAVRRIEAGGAPASTARGGARGSW